jgi:aminoglycoside phosphotransferase (APT) family kinase protein
MVMTAAQPADVPEARPRLAAWLRDRSGADRVEIHEISRLSGGAIQENWALAVTLTGGPHAGRHVWVLRTDAPSAVPVSLTRLQEFAVLRTAHHAGVLVPAPLWSCGDHDVIGRDFFLMQKVAGIAAGHRLTRDAALVPDPDALARQLGANLARIHAIRPPCAGLDFLPPAAPDHALATLAQYRSHLDLLGDPHPALEWGLRWCERHAPPAAAPALIHRDYRTGNYMVHEGRLAGVLDWEFAGWGDPGEDIGWFMARCWRFSGAALEAGGIARGDSFLQGYASVGMRRFSRAELRYWQVMAHLRWAIIALQQAERHLSGQERSLELALTGTLLPELEYEILSLTTDASEGVTA